MPEWDEQGNPVQEWDEQGNPWAPLRGAQIKAQPSLLSRIGSQIKGFGQELPLTAVRGFRALEDIASGNAAMNTSLPPEEQSKQILASEKRYNERKRLDEMLNAAKPGEDEQRWGRIGARMVPGIAAAIGTSGGSIAGQGLIQGGVQGLQSLSEGASPGAAGLAAAMAGVSPAAGSAANYLVSKVKAPFAGKVDQKVVQALERLNKGTATPIELPASAITNSSLSRGLEQMGSKMIGGGAIESRGLKALEDISARAGQASAGANPMVAGRGVAADEAATRASLQGIKNAEYAKLGDPNAFPAPEGLTADQLDAWIKQGTMAPDQLATLKKLRAAIAPAEQPQPDLPPEVLAALESWKDKNGVVPPRMREEILQRAGLASDTATEAAPAIPRSVANLTSEKAGIRYGGPNATGEKAIDNRLRDLLDQDIDNALFAAKPEEAAQLKIAKGANTKFRDFTDSELAGTVAAHQPQGQFDQIAEAVLSPKSSAADIQRLMDVSSPETKRNLGQVLIQKIVGNAENLTPKRIGTELYKYRNVARHVLTDEQISALRDLSTIREAMGKTVIGSPTTPLLQSRKYIEAIPNIMRLLATGGGGAVGNAMGAVGGLAAEMAGETAITNRLGSKAGQTWLTKGFGPATRPGQFIRGVGAVAPRVFPEIEADRRRAELDALLAGR